MIIDSLDTLNHYTSLHPEFSKVIEVLNSNMYKNLPNGKHIIEKDRLYMIIEDQVHMPEFKCTLEAHKKYIDIQCVIDGSFSFGWKHIDVCNAVLKKYSEEYDIVFFSDEPLEHYTLQANQFAVFFPHDAHAPRTPSKYVKKVIFKVRV
jgi:YhcH/YjgK/YiaL family protein